MTRTPRIGRREWLKGGLAAGLSLPLVARLDAQDDAAAMRPRPGDLLVRDGDDAKTPLTPGDILDVKATVAWAMEPSERVVRSASRFNRIVVVRVGPGGDDIFAHTIICPHDGCDVTEWLADQHMLSCPCHYSKFDPKEKGRVAGGPAPRALPQLPLAIVDGKLVVAQPFTSRVGFESQ